MNPEMHPLNETVLNNYLKMKDIRVEDADPEALSNELAREFTNADPERIADMLEKLDRPMVFLKSAAAIDFDDTPSVKFYIDGLLSEGLSMLTAPPKGGKSRLMLQMALAICEGSMFLGRKCEKNGVLYLALEDQRIDFENRLYAFLEEKSAPENLFYATIEDFDYSTPTLDRGQLIPLLEANIAKNPEIKVILIDVFGVIRSHREKGEDFTMHERRDCQTLLRFVGKHAGLAVVVAHHVSKTGKKQGGLEAIGSGAGSYVISGSIHSEMLLKKGERDSERVFSIEGRRVPAQKFMLTDDFPRWRYVGTKEDYDRANNPLYLTIKRITAENGGVWKGSFNQIVEANRSFTDIPNISKGLNRDTFTGNVVNDLQAIGISYKQIKNGNGVLHKFEVLST